MSCPICFEDMDMKEFKDENEGTVTCHKLECGHAYHTKCIVNFLTKTQQACPSCNKHKTPEQILELQGILVETMKEVVKDPRIKFLKKDFKETKDEYLKLLTQIKKEAKEWAANRAKELAIDKYREHHRKSRVNLLNTAREVASEMGKKYVAALYTTVFKDQGNRRNYQGYLIVETALYGKESWRYVWTLKNPSVYFRLF
jgi:hypothetical protein